MIQKKKFSDAIAANISVVGGLLPLGSLTQNGLMNMGRSYRSYAGTIVDFGGDANNLYNYVDAGEYIILIGVTSINTPITSGMLKHIQRMGKGNNTASQEIIQYLYDAYRHRTFRRDGYGNSSSIDWSDWTEV